MTMSIGQAVNILCKVHTLYDREDQISVRMGAVPEPWDCPQNIYVEAWQTLARLNGSEQQQFAQRFRIAVPDRRRMRAHFITHFVLSIIKDFLDRDMDGYRSCSRLLFDAFYTGGFDFITDVQREEAGLPPRGDEGWTREELAAYENKMLEAMIRPLPPLLMKTEDI